MCNYSPNIMFQFFSYMLDLDRRTDIWYNSTINYTCFAFKPVDHIVRTSKFIFMKWINEESESENGGASVPLNLTAMF